MNSHSHSKPRKRTLREQLRQAKLDRLQLIENAKKEQQRLMDAVKNDDNLDAFIQEMIEHQSLRLQQQQQQQ
eukprot:CAMPEP_0202700206 /NCGR_PEP_ID=MMETSP1385-20130828/13405_1 /ASSEMBLY_ACC=CAM_ASM_000861 /TAXON_ID=933848 /ORGANISM="Elphidium margaritaceum" /LENGTH=71 /DNA_ID=CAMNT_0049357341 /DNA_START=85 /DNA_END=297 /DNA_ORIENTATION=-